MTVLACLPWFLACFLAGCCTGWTLLTWVLNAVIRPGAFVVAAEDRDHALRIARELWPDATSFSTSPWYRPNCWVISAEHSRNRAGRRFDPAHIEPN